MEFKVFTNPEEKDYDITSSLNTSTINASDNNNEYSEELFNLVGLLEDISEEELKEKYGISMQEYFYPNAQTVAKVTQHLLEKEELRRR